MLFTLINPFMPKNLFDLNRYRETLTTIFITYGARLLVALFLLLIGLWVVNRLVRLINRQMRVHEVDPSLRPFLSNVLNVSLKIMLLVAVIA